MAKRQKAIVADSGFNHNPNSLDYKKTIVIAKNDEQKELMKAMALNSITIVRGSPGSGKTFLAVNYALELYLKKKVDKIIFTRPTVEAGGERLGFLPGDMHDKIDPYMMPIFESMTELISEDLIKKLMSKNGTGSAIRVIPLAFMRGLTFKNAVIVGDEFQNTTPEQVRMLLTRLGENSKMIICGDVKQSDIYGRNGLQDAFELLQGIDGIGFVKLTEKSIVRHPIIAAIEEKYEARSEERDKK